MSEFNKKGIVLIYNDVSNRIGANCDSANLNHIFQRLPEFRDRLVLIENRNQLINPEESIESDIAHHLKNLSYGTDIQVIVAYFGCHGTNDQRGEFLHLLGKNIRTPRLAKISTIIQKNADLHENLKDVKIIVYVNACRGREHEELADIEVDSLAALSISVKGNAGVTNQLQSDGPRNADDLFAQIFTKIQHDKNTFIHFSTIKDQVSLRRQEEGSIFCEALTHEYNQAILKGESIDIERISYRINDRLSKIQIRVGASQQIVGQISQVKHQLDSRLEIGSGYEMEVAEYESDANKMIVLIGDYTSKEAMVYHRKTFEMLNFSITEIYFEDFTEEEIKMILAKQLLIFFNINIIVLLSPSNMEDGWTLNGDRERFKYKFRQFQDPTRLINSISNMVAGKPKLFYIDSWTEHRDHHSYDCVMLLSEMCSESRKIKRRFIPRHADIFMILSTTFTSGDGNFSCFAMNLRTVIRKMLKIDKIFLDDIFYHINSIHQAESGDAPQMQHQGTKRFLIA